MNFKLLILGLAPFLSCQHAHPGAADGNTTPDLAAGPQAVAPWAAPRPPFQPDPTEASYVGSDTCSGCHPKAADTWRASAHSHALETLKPVEAQFNPSCFRCHTTGAGWATGYQNEGATPQLAQVGCESCHGPGSEHIPAPHKPYGTLPPDAEACLPCHTQSNSPDFVWTHYWPPVAHSVSD